MTTDRVCAGVPGPGSPSIASCAPGEAILPHPVAILHARKRALPLGRLRRRGDLPVRAASGRNLRVGGSRKVGRHAAPHDARSGARHPAGRRDFAEKRLRDAMPVITTCNGRVAGAPARGDAATRERARLCVPRSTVLCFLGDFDGNRGQSTGSILRKSSICH
ncbi:hypothetical protein [Burkholderia cepacia]|uniref:hypothetical protein n=1 Tax=Burkholderia cepacia TaxID=292 RepID=UPI0012D2C73F|nr:hypothetical protein [Burkholderia cepacia]